MPRLGCRVEHRITVHCAHNQTWARWKSALHCDSDIRHVQSIQYECIPATTWRDGRDGNARDGPFWVGEVQCDRVAGRVVLDSRFWRWLDSDSFPKQPDSTLDSSGATHISVDSTPTQTVHKNWVNLTLTKNAPQKIEFSTPTKNAPQKFESTRL